MFLQSKKIIISLAVVLSLTAHAADKKKPAPAAAEEPTPVVEATPTPSSSPTEAPKAEPSATPTAVPSAAPSATPEAVSEKPLEKPFNPYQSRKFGFMITPGLALPHPFYLDLDYRIFPKLSFAIGGGGLVLAPKISDLQSTKLGILAGDVRMRWHPWGRSFFLGVKGGMQNVFARATKMLLANATLGTVETTAEVSLKYPFVAPHFGWMGTWNNGFTMGFEMGVQVPLGVKTTITTTTAGTAPAAAVDSVKGSAEYAKMEKDLKDLGDQVGKIPLPVLTLFKVGWMF